MKGVCFNIMYEKFIIHILIFEFNYEKKFNLIFI